MAFSGNLNFNPLTDSIETTSGPFRFAPPEGDLLPPGGYSAGDASYSPSPLPAPQPKTEVVISPTSRRLEVLQPFASNLTGGQGELPEMTCLMRVRGKWWATHRSSF